MTHTYPPYRLSIHPHPNRGCPIGPEHRQPMGPDHCIPAPRDPSGPTCEIRWVSPDPKNPGGPWIATPDTNPAIGTVVLDKAANPRPLHICAEHAKVFQRDNLSGKGWTFDHFRGED